MEDMMLKTIAQLMSEKTAKNGRRSVKPEHVVKVPANHYVKSDSKQETRPVAVYVAEADDAIVVARVWASGSIVIYLI